MSSEQDLLQRAVNEITSLRRHNEIMGAKLEVFDSFMQVLNTTPATKNVGMSPDLVWEMQKRIDALKKEETQIQNQ